MTKKVDELEEKVVNNDEKASSEITDSVNIKGVSSDLLDKGNSSFSTSEDWGKANSVAEGDLSNLRDVASNGNIISDSTWKDINSTFKNPSAVTQADSYLKNQLTKIQSGKTSYSDQVKDMMDKIMNREKFSYDVDTDPLFQQALASAMNSGKQAMQDTIGQASALTGGYGSTYATTAGNQAYNAFIEDAYDNLPQYYQMAREAYQMEGDEMYRQYGMLSDADAKEYDRMVAAYDATYQHRNQLYNEAYSQFRDKKSDAYASANLQITEHGQKVSDAYNLYQASSDYADKMYEREYQSWADSINQIWKTIDLANSDYWSQTNFDEGVRQYEKNYAQTEDHFTRNQAFQAEEAEKNRAWQTSEAEKDRAFTASENAKSRAASRSGGSGGYGLTGIVDSVDAQNAMLAAANSENVSMFYGSVMTEKDLKNRGWKAKVNGKTKSYDNYEQYICDKAEEWLKNGNLSEHQYAYLMAKTWDSGGPTESQRQQGGKALASDTIKKINDAMSKVKW